MPDLECCPICEQKMQDMYLAGAEWLECTNQQCSHTIEASEED